MRVISERVRSQCQIIAEHARVVTGSQRAILLLYDEAIRRLVTVATTGADLPLQQVALELIRRNYPGFDPLNLSYRPTINPTVAAAFAGQRTQVNTMSEAFENIYPPPVMAVAHGLVGITHAVSCPVIAEQRALGLIRFLVGTAPSDAEQALMEAAANQIGLTLANAELAEQTRRQLAATRAMAEVARLGVSAGVQPALSALAARARELTDAEAATVYLLDASGDTFAPAAESLAGSARAPELQRLTAPPRMINRGLVGWVIASGEAAFVPDVRRDPRTRSQRSSQTAEAVIAVPLRLSGHTKGCLRLSVMGQRRFTESDLWLAQTLADEAALAVQGAEEQEHARAAARTAGALATAAAAGDEMAEPIAELLRVTADVDGAAQDPEQLRQRLQEAHAAAEHICTTLRALNHSPDCKMSSPSTLAGDGAGRDRLPLPATDLE
jgi:GAF domain-containing protein